MHHAWELQSTGSRATQLRNKFINVKQKTLEWNKKVFGKVEIEIKMKQSQLQQLQDSIVTSEDVMRERVCREELEELLNREELIGLKKLEQIGSYMGIVIQNTFKLWLDRKGPRIV